MAASSESRKIGMSLGMAVGAVREPPLLLRQKVKKASPPLVGRTSLV